MSAKPPDAVDHRPMSFQNRLLLNRAAIAGVHNLEVMLIVPPDRVDAVTTRVASLGGQVRKRDRDIGYMRVTLPAAKLLALIDANDVDVYQISSFARGQWYRDGWPNAEAVAFRGRQVRPPAGSESPTSSRLPTLAARDSRASGYTADDETGVGEWMREHPTFDGRGVTIALLETGQPDFTRLLSSTAKTIEGRDVPKLAGIVNELDPEGPDETRVELETTIHATSRWVRIGRRTYIVPHAGAYRFGVFRLPAGSNLVHDFGVLEDEQNGDVRIDTNGDASFQDETPLADVNGRSDVRFLKLTYPRKIDLGFVMARGQRPHTIHVYCGRDGHQTMTSSVAAGSRSERSLSSGVAPNARVLLVRVLSLGQSLAAFVEGYIAASARADVDVITDSAGMDESPNMTADFMRTLFGRITAYRHKPIFRAAGNEQLVLNAAHTADGAFSVGGSIGPQAFAALYGGGLLDSIIVHPTSSAGPSIDGGIKPDFLAPMHRLSTSTPWAPPVLLPKNAPAKSTGPGYEISCCTSASSPYAAGLAALLLSAAKQEHVSWSLASLGRAMRIGARFLPDTPSYLQGNGVLDVNEAWRELTRPVDVPVIRSTAHILHPLARYATQAGSGIFEISGWKPGATGRRTIEFRRESGPAQPVPYRLSWTGNDGTFATASTITLPLDQPVALPVTISLSAPGVHSALLNVHEKGSSRIVFRTQATIVAPEPVNPESGAVHMSGVLPLMRMRTHYVDVPAGAGAMEITIRVLRGIVRPTVVPSHTLLPESTRHSILDIGPQLDKGAHSGIVMHPIAGMWTIDVLNNAVWQEPDTVEGVEAEYAVDVRLLRTTIDAPVAARTPRTVSFENRGSAIREPVLETSDAIATSHQEDFESSGLPRIFDIDIPPDTGSLLLRARSAEGEPLELYLYDCVTGECFLQNFTLPASAEQVLQMRHPHAGRWKAAVNSAPNPAATGHFTLDAIVATGQVRRTPLPHGLGIGERLSQAVPIGPASTAYRQIFCELIDAAADRDLRDNVWFADAQSAPLMDRPAAGWTVVPIR